MKLERQKSPYERIRRAGVSRQNQLRQEARLLAATIEKPFDEFNGPHIADLRAMVENINQMFFEMSAYWNAANTARDIERGAR